MVRQEMEKELYVKAESYIECEEGMENEVSMWYVAGGLFLQEIIIQKKGNLFGEIKGDYNSIFNTKNNVTVLDFCCGPSVFTKYLKLFYSNIDVVGVDLNENFIEYSRNTFGEFGWRFFKDNAITYNIKEKFDFVVGSSAYHHIQDNNKVEFLLNMRKHLKINGKILICENFLPEYSTKPEKVKAIHNYYNSLRSHFITGNGTELSVKVVDELIYLELSNTEEHKVCYSVFKKHLDMAGLSIKKEIITWTPAELTGTNAGSRVMLIEKVKNKDNEL